MEPPAWNVKLGESYDRIAERYAEHFFHELDGKRFDRELLDRFAAGVAGGGPVCDLGCGPGHVARYLAARGLDVFGVDLSGRMVAVARRMNPAIPFGQGDMLALGLATGLLAGIAAFYSVIHIERQAVDHAMREMLRVLRPDGSVLIAVHGGEGEAHVDEWFGEPVAIDATLFAPGEIAARLLAAGFRVDEVVERAPYDFEYQSRRVYAAARKPV